MTVGVFRDVATPIGTPTKKGGHTDEGKIRAQAVRSGVPQFAAACR